MEYFDRVKALSEVKMIQKCRFNKITLVWALLLLLPFPVSATILRQQNFPWRGFYLGAMATYSWTHYGNQFLYPVTTRLTIDQGPGSSFHFGYNFNLFSAGEIGAAYLHKTVFRDFNQTTQNARIKNNMVYIALKLSAPLPYLIRVFTKIGYGYVVRDRIIFDDIIILPGGEFFRPIVGFGLNWRPAMHWELELAWLQAAKLSQQHLPRSDFVGLGAQYLF